MKNFHTLTLLALFVIVSCSSTNRFGNPRSIPVAIVTAIEIQPPVNIDTTLPRLRQADTAKIRKALMKPVQHMIEQRDPPYDSLVKWNYEWARHYFRVVDTSIKRRATIVKATKARDSALIVAKETRGLVKDIKAKQDVKTSIGEGFIVLTDSMFKWLIIWTAFCVTVPMVLNLFRKNKTA